MKLEITVPSKTFLIGEYLALLGGPTLLLNSNPRFKLKVTDSNDPPIHHNINSNISCLKYMEKYQDSFQKLSLSFYDPFFQRGGFGASSALYAMIVTLRHYLENKAIDIFEVINEYQSFNKVAFNFSPSGADIVSQLHGGIIYFNRKEKKIKKLFWPFKQVSICLIPTHNNINTFTHLQKLNGFKATGLEKLVRQAFSDLEKNDLSGFSEALTQFSKKLKQAGFVHPPTQNLIGKIQQFPYVFSLKGCGALGADVIFVLIANQKLKPFIQYVKSFGLQPLVVDHIPSEGVTIKNLDSSSIKEEVILVDENDQQIGIEEKISAHQRSALHRAFSIFIYRKKDNDIEFLLQQRSTKKYHCAGLWSNTCCSHPHPGEDIYDSAHQRLKQEMGIMCQLREIGAFKYQVKLSDDLSEHEIDHVFIGEYPDKKIVINPAEVNAYEWVSLQKLNTELISHPQNYTPWLRMALELVLSKNIF